MTEAGGPAALRAMTVVFWVLIVLTVAVHAAVAWVSLTQNPFWEDEAFNLTVPLNMLRGLGYASDGTLSGSVITPFDPRISTGPVVLVPVAAVLATGIEPVIGARLVPLAYFAALLVALGLLGRWIGGRWASLIAIAVPLAFTARALPSPIQGPADLLGEIPAAALLAWALLALRRRPWLAGLLLGCAIQAKYISFLAVPAFVVALVLVQWGAPWRRRIMSLLAPAACAVLPTALVEVAALVSLGPARFIEHLREIWFFLRSGGQPGVETTVGEKLGTLAASWQLPAVVSVVAFAAIAALCTWAVAVAWREPDRRDTMLARAGLSPAGTQLQTLIVALLGLGAFMGWWVSADHLPLWVRHPSPGILAFVPVLAAFTVLAVRVLWQVANQNVARVGAGVLAAVLSLTTAAQVTIATADATTRDAGALATQRADAAAISVNGSAQIAVRWGGLVSIAVLSGAHVALLDAPVENIRDADLLLPLGELALCGDVLVETPTVTLCQPR